MVPIGKAIAKVDFEKEGQGQGGGNFSQFARESILKKNGYSAKDTEIKRRFVIINTLNKGFINKNQLIRYFSTRVSIARKNEKHFRVLPSLLRDKEFVEKIKVQGLEYVAVDNLEHKIRKDEKNQNQSRKKGDGHGDGPG